MNPIRKIASLFHVKPMRIVTVDKRRRQSISDALHKRLAEEVKGSGGRKQNV